MTQGDTIRQRARFAHAQASVGPIVAKGKAEMHVIATLFGHTPDALILDFCRRTGTVALRKAQVGDAYAQYQHAVPGASRDVEDALIRIRTEPKAGVGVAGTARR